MLCSGALPVARFSLTQAEQANVSSLTVATETIHLLDSPLPQSQTQETITNTLQIFVPDTTEQLDALTQVLTGEVAQTLAEFSLPVEEAGEVHDALNIELLSLDFDGYTLTLNLGKEAAKLQGHEWQQLIHQIDLRVSDLLYQELHLDGLSLNYYLLVDGIPLDLIADHKSPEKDTPELGVLSTDILVDPATQVVPSGIQGKKIVLSPGHGRYDNGVGGWPLQRSYYYGIVEDYINLDLVAELNGKVAGTGADARSARQVNKNAGNHGSGNPWWQMDGSEYIRNLGAPTSVWKPDNLNGINRDIASRPEYANWISAAGMVSIHNNGGGGPSCNSHGTETWYDTSNGYQKQSLALANAIQNKLIQRIRQSWDPNWCNRGVKGSNGGYGENRRFRGPAVIVELAFMDVQSDNTALQTTSFRTTATEAIKDALLEYYGSGVSCPTITDWRSEYWNNRTLGGNPILCRNDTSVNFDWGSGGPGGGVPNDNFSARWTRNLYFSTGNYRFHVRSDDGIRLWLDGNLIIDAWRDQAPTEYTVDRSLSAGSHSLKIEFYENGGGAVAQFWYEQTSSGNMALNRPASATSQQGSGYEPYRGNDGSTATRWSSRISSTLGDEWWWVDLGSQTFNTVVIRWEAAYAAQHFVGWSNDGVTFSGYWYTISSPGSYGYNLGTQNARYVGLLMRNRAPGMGNYSFWELEVYRNGAEQSVSPELQELQASGDLVSVTLSKP